MIKRLSMVIAAVLAAAVVGSAVLAASESEGDAVRRVVREAVRAVYQGGSFERTDWAGPSLRAGVAARLSERLDSDLRGSMAGGALKHYREVLGDALDRERTGRELVSLGGGARDFEWDKVDIGQDVASVAGTALVYRDWMVTKADWKDGREGRAQRRNVFRAHLVRTGDGWRVDDLYLNAQDAEQAP